MPFAPSKSTVKDDTLVEFLYSDVQSDLECVPGIGPANKETLEKHGIETTYQLFGYFLQIKTAERDVVEHCNIFFEWLGQCGVKNNRHNITKSVAEKLAISFPNLYAESYFMEPENDMEINC